MRREFSSEEYSLTRTERKAQRELEREERSRERERSRLESELEELKEKRDEELYGSDEMTRSERRNLRRLDREERRRSTSDSDEISTFKNYQKPRQNYSNVVTSINGCNCGRNEEFLCGANGRMYLNKCLLYCSGTTIAYDGRCM